MSIVRSMGVGSIRIQSRVGVNIYDKSRVVTLFVCINHSLFVAKQTIATDSVCGHTRGGGNLWTERNGIGCIRVQIRVNNVG